MSSLRAIADRLGRLLLPLWRRDGLFLLALAALNLFFARRTWNAGIWADNDSVSHYAYLRYFVEEFAPKTGTFLGWCPKYNLGLPYLLFNVPPLLYVTTGYTSLLTGITPLASLKLWMVMAYLGVPMAAYALASTFEVDETTGAASHADLPRFVALATSLFSSELFGLEFFFKNGMLNPAFAVPLLLAALACFRRALTTPRPRALAWIAATGLCFTLTLLTHTLSAYMLSLSLVAFAFGAPRRDWGANILAAGTSIVLGVLLAGFWLVPSLPFGAKTDAAYTWIRDPGMTLGHLADGSLLSSYPVGFFPRFVTISNAAIAVNACVLYGAWRAARARTYAFLGCALTLVLALWIAIGPRYPWLIDIAPMYDRLLWYRFATLVAAMAFVLGGYGAWQLARRDLRGWPINWVLLGAAAIWAFYVMTGRAVKVTTASNQPEYQASFDAVAGWLKAKGDRRGRVFSEFLGTGVIQAISVNYPREMIPVVTGFDEVGGWIYENNPASQVLQKKGLYWYDPLPMIELAPRYDVKYVVAGTQPFTKALSEDPRWTKVLETQYLVLFEAKRAPSRVEAAGWRDARVDAEEYVRGGGYRYAVALGKHGGDAREASELLVKTNGSPGWRATAEGRVLATKTTPDGLLAVELPADIADDARVELVWDVRDLRRKGNLVSFAGLLIALLLVGASRLRRLPMAPPARAVQVVGLGGFGLAVLALAVLARKRDLSHVGFGVADGMDPVFEPPALRVGRFDDLQATRPNHLLASAWGERALCSAGEPCRRLAPGTGVVASMTLGPAGPSAVTLRASGAAGQAVDLVLEDPEGQRVACRVRARVDEEAVLPADCVIPASPLRAPGVVRLLRIVAAEALDVTAIDVRTGIAWLEAESFRNVLDDGGGDAFYVLSPARTPASNGIALVAAAGWDEPIDIRKEVELPAGAYAAWGLTRVFPEQFRPTRADIVLLADGREVGTLDPKPHEPVPFWAESEFAWEPIGELAATRRTELTVSFRWREHAEAALGDLDAVALVPIAATTR